MDFPISPSDLPWWGWTLSMVVGWLVSVVIWAIADTSRSEASEWFGKFVAIVIAVASFLAGLIGVIRFVKWVWNG